jgi:alcohol dehydrogenase class IV
VLAVGGGSAIDTAKVASAVSGLPQVSVPTTYSGAEWTEFYGVRDPGKRMLGGGGGANLAAIVYDPQLTLELPRSATGHAMNALAICGALYPGDPTRRRGAALIVEWLPRVLEELQGRARTHSSEGAAAGEALATNGLYLAAMAQRLALLGATARSTRSVCHGDALHEVAHSRSRWCPSRPWRAWRDSQASRGSETSAFPRQTWASWPRRSRCGRGRVPTRARQAPRRSPSYFARSGKPRCL